MMRIKDRTGLEGMFLRWNIVGGLQKGPYVQIQGLRGVLLRSVKLGVFKGYCVKGHYEV